MSRLSSFVHVASWMLLAALSLPVMGQSTPGTETATNARGATDSDAIDDTAITLQALKPFEGRIIGSVRLEAERFNGEFEEIRDIQGYANFIKNLAWLKQRVTITADRPLKLDEVREDLQRLEREGLFERIRAIAQSGATVTDPVTLVYRLRSKPVREIVIWPDWLQTEGLAALKARMSIKEGQEYTEFKGDRDVKTLTEERPNLGHVKLSVKLRQRPDGQFADGFTVYFSFVENRRIDDVKFTGHDQGKGQDDLKKLLTTAAQLFVNTNTAMADARIIRETYYDEGWCFCEVTWRITEERQGERTKTYLVFHIQEGPKVEVTKLRIKGLELLIPGKDDRVFEQPTDLWDLWYSIAVWESDDNARARPFISPLKGDGNFKWGELRRDVLRMQEHLRNHGWLDARVYLEHVEFSRDRAAAELTYRFVPGPLYTVRSITFKGTFDKFTIQELHKGLQVKEGGTYRKISVEGQLGNPEEGDVKRLARKFRDEGYYNCEVKLTVTAVSPNQVDLVYDITQGDRMLIGQVVIRGNNTTKATVIRNYLGTQPDKWYSQTTMEYDQLRLMRLGWFGTQDRPGMGVRITPRRAALPNDPRKYVDIDVEVEEGQTGSLNLGVGWSSERGIVGFIQITKRNFDIADFPTFTGGGQEISINLAPGPQTQTYNVRFTEPFFFGSRFSYTANFTHANEALPSFNTLDWVISNGFGYLLDVDLIVRLTYKWNWFKAYNVSSNSAPAILEAQQSQVYSSLQLALDFDRRDDVFLPTRGYNIQASMEIGGRYLGGTVDYWHLSSRLSLNFPIPIPFFRTAFTKETALTFRFAFDWQEPYGPTQSVPILRRLALGGSATPTTPAMRGFGLEGVGPRDSNNFSLRGTARLVGNAEFRVPLRPGLLWVVLFFDIGQLQSSLNHIQLNHWNMSYGFGLRLRLPISPAPLALDFGFPIQKYDGDDVQNVSFSLGFNF